MHVVLGLCIQFKGFLRCSHTHSILLLVGFIFKDVEKCEAIQAEKCERFYERRIYVNCNF